MFEKTLYAGWGDMDFNGHMRNTAYLDRGADVRMMFFSDHGFSMREFEERRMGPVIVRDELEYFRELRLLEPFRVTLQSSGLSEDGVRFRLVNEFWRAEDGKLAARVTSTGLWFDLDQRRPTPAPAELRRVLEEIPRTDGFEVLPSR